MFWNKPYSCLICGKRAGKENLRSPGEKGISAFVRALGVRGACNTLKKNKVSTKWHPSYYSTITNSKDL